ncbi:MAG TPA: hypothetical protein VFX30_09990 [bacterium]|nr:hypothetical protein [bacterium]
MEGSDEKPVTASQLQTILGERLIEFYRRIVEPGIERIFEEKFEEKIAPLRDGMHQGFDDLCKKYEMLHNEYVVINYSLNRLEKKMDRVELRMDSVESEVSEVKDRLAGVERKLTH